MENKNAQLLNKNWQFKNTIDENVTIPSGTNGVSAGTTKISPGYTVTVQGEWRIV